MATKDLVEQRLNLIEQRLGETEHAQRKIDWSVWSARLAFAGVFAVALLAVVLAPFEGLTAASVVGNAMLILAFVSGYLFHLWRFRPEYLNQGRKQVLFATSVIVCAAGSQLARAYVPASDFNHEWLIPLMLFAIVYAVVFDQRYALDATVFTAISVAIVSLRASQFEPLPLLVLVAGSLTAVLLTRNLRSRYKLALVGLSAGAAQGVLVAALVLSGAWKQLDLLGLVYAVAVSLARGMVLGMCATFLLPLLERVFKITTDLSLIELLEKDHPLLQLMQERAPGTYQHTRNVANFTKRAVEAIGGNALLAEVGIMFHDLGKMVRPEYFTENEPESKLLHDRLSPMMSAMIIISHVSDGILIARKHKLPSVIEDFITGHHGTSVVKYFFFKAKQGAKDGEVILESQFRYPGPKPQSKESAISAVADHVEATARSKFAGGLQHPDDLRNMVRDTITAKLLDGQFDDCDITRAELAKVEDSLVKSLAAMYHHRVKYLEDPDAKRRQEAVAMREKHRQDQAQRKEKILTQ